MMPNPFSDCRNLILACLGAVMLAACASKEDLALTDDPLVMLPETQEPAYIPTYSTAVVKGWPKGRELDPHDRSRVRLGEEVHAYHLGRLPSNDRREMHEAHTVYRVEQNAQWDTRLPATPMESRGVVLGIVEPSRAEVPHNAVIEQERQSLVAKSLEMQKSMARLTALQQDLEKKRKQFEDTEAEAVQIKQYLEEVRAKLAETEEKLNKANEYIRQLDTNQKLGLPTPSAGARKN